MSDHPGPHIAAQRKRRGLSQRALAERAGVSPTTIRKIEHEELTPHDHTLGKIYNVLGWPDDEPAQTYRSAADMRDHDEPETRAQEVIEAFIEERAQQLQAVLVQELDRRDYSPRIHVEGRDDVEGYDLAYRSPSGEVVAVSCKVLPPSERAKEEAVKAAAGDVMMRAKRTDASRLLVVTDIPIDEGLVNELRAAGIDVAWHGHWEALDEGHHDRSESLTLTYE